MHRNRNTCVPKSILRGPDNNENPGEGPDDKCSDDDDGHDYDDDYDEAYDHDDDDHHRHYLT